MASSTTCAACNGPLVMTISHDSDSESYSDSESQPQPGPSSSSASTAEETVPDDLHLPCGCHFHWQCLLDASVPVATTRTCPHCSTPLTNVASPAQIQALYTSEGGADESVNLLPLVVEESHLQFHPEERPARALHTMCAENDLEGVVQLLRDTEPDQLPALLTYRDPLSGLRNALHVAVEKGNPDAFWLLLWVASALPEDRFSPEMRRTMASIALERGLSGGEDLRFLVDAEGRTPGDYAAASGGEWEDWVNAGVFLP